MKKALAATLLCCISFAAHAHIGLPQPGSITCPDNYVHCKKCQELGGQSGAGEKSMTPPEAAAPARSPDSPPGANLNKELSDGDSMMVTGMDGAGTPAPGIFADTDIVSEKPIVQRTDMDFSSNGAFGLKLVRTYIQSQEDYSLNNDGKTMLGPGWVMNFELGIEWTPGRYGTPAPGLRDDTGHIVLFRGTGSPWRADPDFMSAKLITLSGYEAYELTTDGGDATYRFSSYGRLLSMTDRNGNQLTLAYNASNRLTTVTASAPDNRYLVFEYYPTNHRLRKVTPSWSNRYVLYTYDVSNRLQSVYDCYGRILENYTYDQPSFVPGTPGNGPWFCINHPTASGTTATLFAIEFHSPYWDGNKFTKYDGAGTKILYQDDSGIWRQPGGLGVALEGTDHAYAPSVIKYYNGATLVRTDSQIIASTLTDAWGGSRRLLGTTRGSDTITSLAYVSSSYNSANYDYTHLKSIQTIGRPTRHLYNDSMGRPTGWWESNDRHTSASYDANGNTSSISDSLGNTTDYGLDPYGRITTVTTPLGTRASYHSGQGKVLQRTDEEGRSTFNEFDSRYRKVAVGSLGTTATYAYDDYDRLTTESDALGNKTVYGYDTRDRLITVTDPLGNVTAYAYSQTTGTLAAITDAENAATSFEYDIFGNLKKVTDPRGKQTTYVYDYMGRLSSETNPIGKTTSYTYDDVGGGGCPSCGSGGAGKLASVTTPDTNTTYYNYDTSDRLTTVTYSGSADKVEMFYDSIGRIANMTDNRINTSDWTGKSFQYAYDALDRVTTETYPDATTIGRTYDAVGRRTSMTDPDGNVTTYVYATGAANKKLDHINHPYSGNTYFDYNNDGLLEQQSYYNFATDEFDYDALHRVSSVATYSGDTPAALIRGETYTYNAASVRTQIDFASDTSFDPYHKLYKYDKLLRLTEEHKRRSDTSASLYRYGYTYDAAGNRTQLVHFDGSSTATTSYNYNDFNQLTDYTGTYGNQYDDNGNLYTIDHGADFAWYTHNRENRLVEYEYFPVGPIDYEYDAAGRLLTRTDDSGNKEKYYYDGINTLLVKDKPYGGSWRTKCVYTLKQASVGQIIAERENTAWSGSTPTAHTDYWYHYDLLGNVTAITDGTGQVGEQYDMEAFGNESGSNAYINISTKRYGIEVGLTNFYMRWLDSLVGRWIEADPIRGTNNYTFAGNNPMYFVDADGRMEVIRRSMDNWWPGWGLGIDHCFVKFSDGSSLSVHDDGTVSTDAPKHFYSKDPMFHSHYPLPESSSGRCKDEQCVKDAMKDCSFMGYSAMTFNCCDCVKRAMNQCGIDDSKVNCPFNLGF